MPPKKSPERALTDYITQIVESVVYSGPAQSLCLDDEDDAKQFMKLIRKRLFEEETRWSRLATRKKDQGG